MPTITLKYLANKLNLSVATVSKALKGYSDVNAETRKKVMALAEELNFQPNSFAVNLRKKESKTIGLIIPEVVHHFFSSVVNGIVKTAENEGYWVIIMQSNESYENEKKQLKLLVAKKVDGILMALSNETTDFTHINNVLDNDIPLVLFDKIADEVNCSKVTIDDVQAAFDATEHLIKTGCKNIVHIRGPVNPLNANARLEGYKKALETYNIPYRKDWVYTCENVTFEEGIHFAEQIITEHPEVDGIFAITDLIAVGLLSKFKMMNIAVPERVSVMGFSNWFMASAVTPPLSTIDQSGYEIGKKAFKQLFKEIKKIKSRTPFKYKTFEIPTKLVIRESTKTIE